MKAYLIDRLSKIEREKSLLDYLCWEKKEKQTLNKWLWRGLFFEKIGKLSKATEQLIPWWKFIERHY